MSHLNQGDMVDVKGEGCVLRFEVVKVDEDRNLFLLRLMEVRRDEQPAEPTDGIPF